jgi:hypothetical protein
VVSLADEQASRGSEPERVYVGVDQLRQWRRTGDRADYANRTLLELAVITILARIGPVSAGMRPSEL